MCRDQESDDNASNANPNDREDAYVKEEDRYLGGDEGRRICEPTDEIELPRGQPWSIALAMVSADLE